jgi:hypothetical protein
MGCRFECGEEICTRQTATATNSNFFKTEYGKVGKMEIF